MKKLYKVIRGHGSSPRYIIASSMGSVLEKVKKDTTYRLDPVSIEYLDEVTE